MAWILALQSSGNTNNQSSNYELQETADVESISQEMISAAAIDRVVAIPVVLRAPRVQNVTVYVRPAAWGAWTLFQLSEDDQRRLMETINALSRAAQQQQQQRARPTQTVQINPFGGQPGPTGLGPLGTNS